MKTPENNDYQTFSSAMDTILKARPEVVRAAMEAEKQERQYGAKQTGKRGRGRPPKNVSSSPASSNRDV